MPKNKYKFEELFKIILRPMQINGGDPKCKRDFIWKVKVVGGNALLLGCFLLLCNSIVFHDIGNGDYPEVIKNGTMALVSLITIAKYNVLIYNQKTFRDLIEIMDQDTMNSENFPPDEKEIVDAYIKRKIRVSVIWAVAAFITGTIFPLKAFVLMIYYALKNEFKFVPIFDLTYPSFINDYKNEPLGFIGVLLLTGAFDLYTLVDYLGFDSVAPILLLHCCSELHLLRLRITKTFSKQSNPQIILRQLTDYNVKLQEIYSFVSRTQGIFIALYEFMMKTTIVLIPFSAFQVMQSLQNKEFSLEFTFFLSAAFIHFYLPCYYSDLLLETRFPKDIGIRYMWVKARGNHETWTPKRTSTSCSAHFVTSCFITQLNNKRRLKQNSIPTLKLSSEGEVLRQSIYACGWEMHHNIQIRKIILFMLTRTISPIVIKTYFEPISLDTFAETCRQSYAIYNILMAVNE